MKITQNYLSLLLNNNNNKNTLILNNKELNYNNNKNNLSKIFEKKIFLNKIIKHNSINSNLNKYKFNTSNLILKGISLKNSFIKKRQKFNYTGIEGLNINKENNKSFEYNLNDNFYKNSINNFPIIKNNKKNSNSINYLTRRKINNCISLNQSQSQKLSSEIFYSKEKEKNYSYQKEISINNLLRTSQFSINLKTINKNYHNYPKTKHSSPYTGTKYIKAFAANSYKGKYLLENQNKIIIILNVEKNKKIVNYWPINFSLFGLYDGFFGNKCSEFLSENLHNNIIYNKYFFKNCSKGIVEGYLITENLYKKQIYENKKINNNNNFSIDNSGSMSVNIFIIEDSIYISNLGDSRILISKNNLKEYYYINNIHNSLNLDEKKRIIKKGGSFRKLQMNWNNLPNNIISPTFEVVMPCKLRTTRCFGAFESKKINKDLILSIPEINKLKINNLLDLIFVGNQEIFNRLNINDIYYCLKLIFFNNCEHNEKNNNCYLCLHKKCQNFIDLIIKSAQKKGALGNLSCLLIIFNEKIGYISSI